MSISRRFTRVAHALPAFVRCGGSGIVLFQWVFLGDADNSEIRAAR